MITHQEIESHTRFAQQPHPDPRAARKARLVDSSAKALARGDMMTVALVTTLVVAEDLTYE